MFIKRIFTVVKFIFLALSVNIIVFFMFTVQGYDAIYNFVKSFMMSEIDTSDDDYEEFKTLGIDGDIKKSNLIVFTEKQGVKLNYEIFKNNFNYLASEYKTRYILLDINYAAGRLIDLYLANGDETQLRHVLSSSKTEKNDADSEEFYSLLTYIMEYNKELTVRDQIEIYGLDNDKSENKELTVKYIDHIFTQLKDKRKMTAVAVAYAYPRQNIHEYYQNMLNSMVENETQYREFFADNYFDFYMALRNYFNFNSNTNVIRADNLLKIYNHNLKSKYYIQLSDASFMADAINLQNEMGNYVFTDKIFYINSTDSDGKSLSEFQMQGLTANNEDGGLYVFNNSAFKYFDKYRKFVYTINKRDYETYDSAGSAKYLIIANSPPVTPLIMPIALPEVEK